MAQQSDTRAAIAPPAVPDEEERELWASSPGAWLALLAAKTRRYVLTTERLVVTFGVLSRRTEQIELFRVKDISVRRGMNQRIYGLGSVRVSSTDPSTPLFVIEDIGEPDQLAEVLRAAVRSARIRHGVDAREFL